MAKAEDLKKALISAIAQKRIDRREVWLSEVLNQEMQSKLHRADYYTFINPVALRLKGQPSPKRGRGAPRKSEGFDLRRTRYINNLRLNKRYKLRSTSVRDLVKEMKKENWQEFETVRKLFPVMVENKSLEQSISRGMRLLNKPRKVAK